LSFQSEKIVGSLGADPLGDLTSAAHGVDGNERARELETFEQTRNGDDLVALLVDRLSEPGPIGAWRTVSTAFWASCSATT
jgi:hypothetical protein